MNTVEVQVGQRVYSGLYGGRWGTVVAIIGRQTPSSVRQLGGSCVVAGGSADFDVAFDNGTRSVVPECIVRGVQWQISDDVATADDILDAVRHCANAAALHKEREEFHTDRRANERIAHRKDNPHLIAEASPEAKGATGGKLVAVNIRKSLKLAFPKITFRVTSDYNAVNVKWTDGPTSAAVEALTNRHKEGDFDGMTDCYNFDVDATFADVFGGAQYVFTRRDETVKGLKTAWQRAGHNPDEVPDDGFEKHWNTFDENLRHWMRDAWANTDLTDIYEPPAKPSATENAGPFWSKRGYLATSEFGISREYRKETTVAAEVDRLRKAGHNVEIAFGRRKGTFFIRRCDA